MAIASYVYYYQMPNGAGLVPGVLTPTARGINSDDLSEVDANPNDSQVAAGDFIEWFGLTNVTLLGVTDDGDPVVQFDGSNDAYILSNNPSLVGVPLNTTATTYTMCFTAGTRISTPDGERLVEDLRIGDSVATSEGRAVSVKWIGRQTVHTRFGPAERLMPVRFAAGSLGEGLPHTDLTVTADHGMLVSGVICHAGALVNGETITRVPLAEMGETYTVYHIETEAHEIILANGAPSETFIDNASRRAFDNVAEFEALYGDVPEMEELSYPRAMSTRQVPQHIRARLAGKAVA